MIDTIQQMPLKDVPRGEFVRRKLDAKRRTPAETMTDPAARIRWTIGTT